MREIIPSLLIILAALLLPRQDAAADGLKFRRNLNPYDNVAGPIVAIKPNVYHITVRDYRDGTEYQFFVPGKEFADLKVGDWVRVYFAANRSTAISIKKMTPVNPTKNFSP